MALQLNGGVWCLYQSRANWGKSIKHQQERFVIKAVASSEDYAATATAKRQPISEEKVKLGASAVEVTRVGIGAWSWGDTTYWNNFEWDGNQFSPPLPAYDDYDKDDDHNWSKLCNPFI